MSDRSSPVSAGSTSDCIELGFDTPSSVSLILGGERCSPSTGPEFPSTRTYSTFGEPFNLEIAEEQSPTLRIGTGLGIPTVPLIFSVEASPARTSPSPDDERGSLESARASSTSSHESLSLFDLGGYSSRTYPDCSPRTAVGTSESCLERWPTSGTAWATGFSTAVTSECRSDEDGCSSSEPSLSQILEPPQNVPEKYSLSARAARGILRRAEKRGRILPGHLAEALESVAGLRTPNA